MRRMLYLPPRLRRHLPAWLAVLAYLAAGCLGGWSLHREAAACRRLARADVVRRVADLEAEDAYLSSLARRGIHHPPVLRLVRDGAR